MSFFSLLLYQGEMTMSIAKEDSIEFLIKLEKEYKTLGDLIISVKKQFSLDDNSKENLKSEILKNKTPKTTFTFVLDYLVDTKEEWNVSEIAKALLNQGIQTASKDFPRMVRSILSQLEKKGKVSRENGKWKSI